MAPEDFGNHVSDTGQIERLLACIEFSKALVSACDMETLLTAVLKRRAGGAGLSAGFPRGAASTRL